MLQLLGIHVPWYVVPMLLLGSLMWNVLRRAIAGKPIFFFTVPDAVFIQRTASGHCADSRWKAMMAARNCLVVAIARGRLVIRPMTPANLMLNKDCYGLEYDVPLGNVRAVRSHRTAFNSGLMVELFDEDNIEHQVFLMLRHPDEFVRHLPEHATVAWRKERESQEMENAVRASAGHGSRWMP